MITTVKEEKNKVYFHVGDIVGIKGIPQSENLTMKVTKIVWATNDDGSLKRKEIGNQVFANILDGILVGWFTSYEKENGDIVSGDWIEKLFDTRDLYIVERSTLYYLQEAKRKAVKECPYLIPEINKLIDKL